MSSILSAVFERSVSRRRKRMSSLIGRRKKKGSLQAGAGSKTSTVKRKIRHFKKWCCQVGIQLHPNVCIQSEGVCEGIGVLTTHHIRKGEVVAVIPRSALLSCDNSHVRDLIKENKKLFKTCRSSWVPLLLALAAEYANKECSKWHPYLSLVPTNDTALPMLWVESVRECLLEGTGIEEWVSKDLERLEQDYESFVKPFARKYPELYKDSLASCDEYKKMVAFVMSYSFTDEAADLLGTTMMVPFVDLLNHSSRHHVELTFHPSCLKLMAIRDIQKGEEVMNTYGQLSNAALLHMYGFTERDNPYDEAVITCEMIQKVYLQLCSNSALWDTVVDMQDMLSEECSVSCSGQPDDDLLMLTRLLCCTDQSRLPHCKQPVSTLDLSTKEKAFLIEILRHRLECYPEQLTAPSPPCCFHEQVLKPPSFKVMPRESHSYQVVLGQQNALRKLLSNLRQ